MEEYEFIHLQITRDIESLIEARHILMEDLQKTIHHAETTGEKFINPSTGRSLASLRPGRVTYWVEYSKQGEAFLIHNAYSHRMEMKRGKGL
jgi:glutamate synthase (NADPH) small chain